MKATITKHQFIPMEVIPSILHIWVQLYETKEEIMFEVEDSIPNLSRRFGFLIVKDDEWDFRGFNGRECEVSRNEGRYFLHGLNQNR